MKRRRRIYVSKEEAKRQSVGNQRPDVNARKLRVPGLWAPVYIKLSCL